MNVLIADDHKLLREGLHLLISGQSDMTVVAEAEDGKSAIQLAARMAPDIVIMDISMPGMNGIEATRRILAAKNDIRVLALSMHADRRMVMEMFKAGASGYLLKDCAFDEVIEAIKEVAAGGLYLSPKIADDLLKDYVCRVEKGELSSSAEAVSQDSEFIRLLERRTEMKEIAAQLHLKTRNAESLRRHVIVNYILPCLLSVQEEKNGSPASGLTSRELEILTWIKDGKSTQDISAILQISQDTVKFHVRNIFRKLGANSRSSAIAIAIENKLLAL